MAKFGIGQAVRRVEDARFITGAGRYVDDIVLPIVKQAGFDPVWFGIFLVLVVEMAQITPPVGFNLFVIQGLTNDGLGYIAKVTLPYLVIMILFTIFITVFPQIPLWLPKLLAGG